MTVYQYTPKDLVRFWSKVALTANPDKCWEWTASNLPRGYGNIRMGAKVFSAHRVAWELTNGEVPANLEVCHTCDNPGCVNPRHLFLGTHQQNMDDMYRKGRGINLTGEQHGMHKLTWEQVLDIRKRYSQGNIGQRALAREMGVSKTQIMRIVHGKSRIAC